MLFRVPAPSFQLDDRCVLRAARAVALCRCTTPHAPQRCGLCPSLPTLFGWHSRLASPASRARRSSSGCALRACRTGRPPVLARRSTALARLATFGRLASPRPVRAPSFAACQAARCAAASYRFRNGRGERALALCRDLPSFPGARFVGRQRFYAPLSGQASSPRAWCAQAASAAFPSRRAASHVRNSPEGFAGRALSASAEKGGR
ncbi:hypothetical protein ERJ75_000608600 [Trypanosoma vivax]|nr:hypothetical protein ERJ75_000608600 [Trypanosoma vivax]